MQLVGVLGVITLITVMFGGLLIFTTTLKANPFIVGCWLVLVIVFVAIITIDGIHVASKYPPIP